MTPSQRKKAISLAKSLLPEDEFEHLMKIDFKDQGLGYDKFGMEKEMIVASLAVVRYVYLYYFRVESEGVHNIPEEGRGLIVPNHSGVIPIDGMMIGVDLAFNMRRPRIIRAMVDNFMGFLPFINVFFARCGQLVGARRNFADLLEADELITVFPEGAKGTGKLYKQRYNLLRFNVGFIELSLQYRAPIIPAAVIGAEEQAPMVYNVKPLARMLGFPYFPVTPFFPLLGPLGGLPMPVKYHLYYGEPMHLYEDYGPEAINDPNTIRMLADRVQMRVQEMVNKGLDERTSVFGFLEA
ncbi:MAG: acyltransferase family protein [Deltaproteobacteria bacterium]|nr:acyltransferase family protein [Deltaproteobacteria bacterium]MCB9478959.1 acyltransferase family protein [Deltaproteobacteria bacterium]MCB9487836.1 acyltransferase family protein [Deltaproteobacteria bacterium]